MVRFVLPLAALLALCLITVAPAIAQDGDTSSTAIPAEFHGEWVADVDQMVARDKEKLEQMPEGQRNMMLAMIRAMVIQIEANAMSMTMADKSKVNKVSVVSIEDGTVKLKAVSETGAERDGSLKQVGDRVHFDDGSGSVMILMRKPGGGAMPDAKEVVQGDWVMDAEGTLELILEGAEMTEAEAEEALEQLEQMASIMRIRITADALIVGDGTEEGSETTAYKVAGKEKDDDGNVILKIKVQTEEGWTDGWILIADKDAIIISVDGDPVVLTRRVEESDEDGE